MIDSLLEPMPGIEMLLKDTPEEYKQRQDMKRFQCKPCNRNRKNLRGVMSKTKPISNGDERDPANSMDFHVLNHVSRINNTTDVLKNYNKVDQSP